MAPRNIPVSPHNNRYRTAAAVRFVHRITPPPAKASSTPCQREWINTQQIACIISSIDFAFRTCHHLLPHLGAYPHSRGDARGAVGIRGQRRHQSGPGHICLVPPPARLSEAGVVHRARGLLLLRHLHGNLARHRAGGDADAAPLDGALAALLRPGRRRAVATGPVLGSGSPVRAPARTRHSAPARQPVAARLRPGDLADAVDDGRLRHRRRRGRATGPRGRASQSARESDRVRRLRGARRPRRGRERSRGLGRGDRPRHLDRRRGVLVAAPRRPARTRPRRPALSPH